jgi:hypothetical protein
VITRALHPKAKYAGSKCPLTGKEVTKGVHVLYANHVVEVCCVRCLAKVKADPAGTLAEVVAEK